MPRTSLILIAALCLPLGLQAQPEDYDRPNQGGVSYAYADVLRSDPVYERVRVSAPREECYDERVTHRDGRGNNAGGTILGAIVGGALGNQVGKGDGRKAATIAGAVAGGAIGNSVAKRDDRGYESTETRCHVVDSGRDERRIVAYDIDYRFRGEVYSARLNYDPGDRLRVRVEVTPVD